MAYKHVKIDRRIGNPNSGRPKKYTTEFIENEADLLLEFFKDENKTFLKEFSIERKYPSQYLSEFANENEKFSEALNRCKDLQELRLVKNGLREKWNPWFTGLTLKNVSGWRDKQEFSGYVADSESSADREERRKKLQGFLSGITSKTEKVESAKTEKVE